MISVDDARSAILNAVPTLAAEPVGINEAIGRVTGALTARRTLPPWNNSAMDGFAVRSDDATTAPIRLRVTSTIFAGDQPTEAIGPGCAARIMTGAPLPPGADAVIMQERTTLEGDHVTLLEPVKPGANVRKRGEDVLKGAPLFGPGHVLSVADAGLLWSQGFEHVHVPRRPRVAVASSGDELVDVGSTDETRIIDSNTPVIAALAARAGAEVTRLGRARDTLESQRALFERGLTSSDVLITIAGASVGERDFTRRALEELGVQIDFWKVAMKPGKPLAFGRKGDCVVFGLPGNPVSAMVTFELFVRPALRATQGLPPLPPLERARLTQPINKAAGLRHFVRGTLESKDGVRLVTPRQNQSSGALTSTAGATCLIDVAEAVTRVEEGNEINVFPLDWA